LMSQFLHRALPLRSPERIILVNRRLSACEISARISEHRSGAAKAAKRGRSVSPKRLSGWYQLAQRCRGFRQCGLAGSSRQQTPGGAP
jgi:hypothetical protein